MTAHAPIKAEARQSGFVRRMIDSHSVLGLGFAALIYIVSLTGAFTLFVPEITLWENRGVVTADTVSPNVAARAMENAEAQLQDGNEILNIIYYGPDDFKPYASVRLNERPDRESDLQSTDWFVDPQSGALLGTESAPYAHLIEYLHTALHLPNPWGRYLVGLLGVVMFTLILSGIFAHPTIFKDAFKLRLKRNARLAWTDVHNRLSVWGLPYHLVLTFTGAFLGVAGVIVAALAFVAFDGDQERAIAVINGPPAIEGAPPMSAPVDYAAMMRSSQAEGRSIALVVANNPKDSGQTTSVVYGEAGILSARSSDMYRNYGEFLDKVGGRGSAVGYRIFGAIQPLHYGTFGGYPIKWLYFVLALALTYITSTGMMIWFRRKMQQGEPRPRHEAAWRGMTTGLTLALSVGALMATSGVQLPLAPISIGVWAGMLLVMVFVSNVIRWVRAAWLASAAFLLVALLVNIAQTYGTYPVSWVTNFLLAGCVAGLIFAALRLDVRKAAKTSIEDRAAQPAE